MYQGKKVVLIFGVGPLQKSIINRAKRMGLFTVGIDPAEDAVGKDDVDAFEVVGGQDFSGTCAVVDKYGIDAIVTAATDKPLVMMARVAEKYGFPFYSVDTAQWSTDKFLMKQRFMEGRIPCAKGRLVKSVREVEDFEYPVIVKPRDNSGSRGVKLCHCKEELDASMREAFEVSKLDTVLVEEFIDGPEYSIEGLHYGGESVVIQFTEKKTTEFPYNVELGHKQPARLTNEQKEAIHAILVKIGEALKFENCPSHTELKITDKGIVVIETSPRLGGDYITSTLVPLSSGINMEDQLLRISLGEMVDISSGRFSRASGVCFLNLPSGRVKAISNSIREVIKWPGVEEFSFSFKEGDEIHPITSSLNRYGQFIVQANDYKTLDSILSEYEARILDMIKVE